MSQLYKIEMDYTDMICPISHQLFGEPVIAEDGFTYEKHEITKWFQNNSYSPITKKTIGKMLQPNVSMRKVVDGLVTANPKLAEARYRGSPDYNTFKPANVMLYREYDITKMKPADIITIITSENTTAIKYFLDNVVDINSLFNGISLLHHVCKRASTDIIGYISRIDDIDHNVRCGSPDINAFEYLAMHRGLKEIQYVLHTFEFEHDSLFHHYIFGYQKLQTIIYIMCNHVVSNYSSEKDSSLTPIHYAFKYNTYHVIKYLLSLRYPDNGNDILEDNKHLIEFDIYPIEENNSVKMYDPEVDDDADDADDADEVEVEDVDEPVVCVYCTNEIEEDIHYCSVMQDLGISEPEDKTDVSDKGACISYISYIGLIDKNKNLSYAEKKDLWRILLKN